MSGAAPIPGQVRAVSVSKENACQSTVPGPDARQSARWLARGDKVAISSRKSDGGEPDEWGGSAGQHPGLVAALDDSKRSGSPGKIG